MAAERDRRIRGQDAVAAIIFDALASGFSRQRFGDGFGVHVPLFRIGKRRLHGMKLRVKHGIRPHQLIRPNQVGFPAFAHAFALLHDCVNLV